MNARLVLAALLLTAWMPAGGAELVATSPQYLILKPPKPVVDRRQAGRVGDGPHALHDHGQRQGSAERHPQQ